MRSLAINTSVVIRKSIKLIVFISLITSLSYYCYGSFYKWSIQPDIATTVHLVSSSDIPFPAVTTCSALFPRQLSWKGIHPYMYLNMYIKTDDKFQLPSREQDFLALMIQTCDVFKNTSKLAGIFSNRSELNLVRLLDKAVYPYNHIYCSFRYKVAHCVRVLNKVFTHYGRCYSFNMLGYHTVFNMRNMHKDFVAFKRKELVSFPHYHEEHVDDYVDDENETISWTLERGYLNEELVKIQPLRALKRNQLYFLNDIDREYDLEVYRCFEFGAGFRAIMHLPNEMPTPLHEELFYQEEFDTVFKIDAEVHTVKPELRRFPPATRQCYFEGERRLKYFNAYTKTHCDYECMANFTLEQCGCVKFSMPRSQDTPVCEIDDLSCYNVAVRMWPQQNYSDVRDNILPCDCYPPCTDIKYSFKPVRISPFRLSYMSYIRINMDFQSHVIKKYERYVAYTLQNLVADIGGLVGLFLGFSLLSIFEFVYGFIERCSASRDNRDSDRTRSA